MPQPVKWKLNRIRAAVCDLVPTEYQWEDPIEGIVTETKLSGCVYHHIFNILAPILTPDRIPRICAFEKVCTGHAVESNVITGKLLWGDGHWKDLEKYQAYQREWFLWLNNAQWKARVRAGIIPQSEKMPEKIRRWNEEPTTPGSVDSPFWQIQHDMERIWNWIHLHGGWLEDTIYLMKVEANVINPFTMKPTSIESEEEFNKNCKWSFVGSGDNRTLHFDEHILNNAQVSNVLSIVEIAYGPDKVFI